MTRRRLGVLAVCLSSLVLVANACKKKDENPAAPAAPNPTATFTQTSSPTTTFTATASPTPVATSTPTVCSTWGGSVANTDISTGANVTVAKAVTFTQAEVITKAHYRTYNAPTAGTLVRVAFYSEAANYPTTLIASSGPSTAVLGWNEVDMGNLNLAAGTYWMAIATNQALSIGAEFGNYDPIYVTAGYLPTPYPSSLTLLTNYHMMALYADICP